MAEFDGFLEEALVAGTGRSAGGIRQIPVFVPGGSSQAIMFETTVDLLMKQRFNPMDIRGPQGCDKAMNSFSMHWPQFSGDPLAGQYAAEVADVEKRLLIMCGSESLPRFWKNLRTSSALYTGPVFPPFLTMSTKCIIVPDAACVCVVVMERDFASLPSHLVGPVFKYTVAKASWIG